MKIYQDNAGHMTKMAAMPRHVKFSKKKCVTARDDELSPCNFRARAWRTHDIYITVNKKIQFKGMV